LVRKAAQRHFILQHRLREPQTVATPDKSDYRTSAVPELHLSGKRVYRALALKTSYNAVKAFMLATNREHWLSRAPAKNLFKFASAIFLITIVFLGAAAAGVSIAGGDRMQHFANHWWVQALCLLLGVVAAPCGIGLWIGMFCHWASTNQSPKSMRVVWLLLFIFGNLMVALLYYFFSYQRRSAAGTSQC
jgi:protein-S-isoprenylcysteine O-methyltransferase Ste14